MEWRDYLIFHLQPRIAKLEGDILEIGVLRGELTVKLAELAAKHGRRVFAVDICDLSADPMQTKWNYLDYYKSMATADQEATIRQAIDRFSNVIFIKIDSAKITFKPEQKFAATVIDGCHEPEHMKGDFRLAWRHLSPGGLIAMHDYHGDLPPEFSKAVDEVITEVLLEVASLTIIDGWWLIVERKPSA